MLDCHNKLLNFQLLIISSLLNSQQFLNYQQEKTLKDTEHDREIKR